jgi:hypothetical protein
MALVSTQRITEMSTRNISWGKGGRCRADNLATLLCRLSYIVGAATSWNPQGLSRPVMGLLYRFTYLHLDMCYVRCVRNCSYRF